MSIATEIAALAANKAAIKAAIAAKNPATAPTDALSQWPTAIASIPSGSSGNDLEPYPWVGSGTHCWLHYDSNSPSHVCQVSFKRTGTVTLDWGDGSATETFEGAYSYAVTRSHTYQDGDFRLDFTGAALDFGSYTYDGSSFSYTNNNGSGLMTDDGGFSTNFTNSDHRDALVQFETDAASIVGNGNDGYCQIGTSCNLRWAKFTEATVIANFALGYLMGLRGLYAPKCKKFWSPTGQYLPSLRELSLPALELLFDEAGLRQGAWFRGCYSLESFNVNDSVSTLPSYFMANGMNLRSLSLPSGLSGTLDSACMYCYSLRRIEIPEGVTVMSGECYRTCKAANFVSLPSTLTDISNSWAMYGMYGLHTIVCRATTPPALANNNILNGGQSNPGFSVWVPQGTVSAYESATNWTKFSGKFHELDANGNIPAT